MGNIRDYFQGKKSYLFFWSIGLLLELYLVTFGRNKLGIWLGPIGLLLTGLLIGILPLFFLKERLLEDAISPKINKKFNWKLALAVGVGCLLVIFILLPNILFRFPIDPLQSDIIPTLLDLYIHRFIQGIPVYTEGLCNGVPCTPNYLPLHWLPFLISYYLNFDPRILGLIFLTLAISISYGRILINSVPVKYLWLLGLTGPLWLFLWMKFQSEAFGHTTESMITAWYIILGLGIWINTVSSGIIGTLFTLLSRYSVAFWLPVFGIGKMISDRKYFYYWIMGVLIGLMGIYVIPFLILEDDLGAFLRGFSSYPIAAMGEWKGQAWQAAGDPPWQLFRGSGFAAWFYTLVPGDLVTKFTICRYTHLSISLGGALLAFGIWYRNRNRIPHGILWVYSLKVYLTIFYAFMIVPYEYLWMVPSGFSIIIFLVTIQAHDFSPTK
jgi:hypothetical protein